MDKRTSDKFWFPWWPDKWIFGSVRIECTPAERGIWVDLLSLASKDNGYIRANEDTPYPLQQLAGMLIIPEKELNDAINKFIKKGKLIQFKNGTLYIAKWDKYQFSNRHKRRVRKEMSAETDTTSNKKDAYNILNNNKKNNKKLNNNTENFLEFWKKWPSESKGKKTYCEKKFIALCKAGKYDEFIKTTYGYFDYLKAQQVHNNFDQRPMHLSTWLNNWEGDKEKYIDFKYKPKL